MITSTANYDFTSHMKMSLWMCHSHDHYQVTIYHTSKYEKLVPNISISWVWAFICELLDIKGKEREVIIANGDISWQSQNYTILKDNI